MITKAKLTTAIGILVVFVATTLWISPQFVGPVASLPMDTPAHYAAIAKLANDPTKVFQLSVNDTYYPPLFHILVIFVMIFGVSIPVAVYLVTIVLLGLILPIGVLLLTREIWTRAYQKPIPAKLNLIALLLTMLIPTTQLAMLIDTRYAFMTALVLLPFLLTVSLRLLDKISRKRLIIMGGLFTLILLAQPRSLFSYLVIFLPISILCLTNLRKIDRKRFNKIVKILSIILGIFSAVVCFYVVKKIGQNGINPDAWFPNVSAYETLPMAIIKYFSLAVINGPVAFVVIILIIASAFFAYTKPTLRGLMISWVIFGIIYVVATATNGPFANLLGAPWYREGNRIISAVPFVVIPMISILLVKMSQKIINSRYNAIILMSVMIILLVGNHALINARTEIATRTDLAKSTDATFYNQQRQDALFGVRDLTEPDALIISNPWNGSVYQTSLTGRKTLFQALNNSLDQHPDKAKIVQDFVKDDIVRAKSDLCQISPHPYILDLGEPVLLGISSESDVYQPLTDLHILNQLERVSEWESGRNHKFALYRITCE